MDIEKREWRTNPPREVQDSLAAMVRDFHWRFPRDRRDTVITKCQDATNLAAAIRYATASIGTDGKMHNHQSRVPRAVKEEFRDRLLLRRNQISRTRTMVMGGTKRGAADQFDTLMDIMGKEVFSGVGPVFLYDTATRIAAYLGFEPTSLYLHAGVRQGIVALHDATVPPTTTSEIERLGRRRIVLTLAEYRGERITQERLNHQWPEFIGMTPDLVEDFLCTYRGVFRQITKPHPSETRIGPKEWS